MEIHHSSLRMQPAASKTAALAKVAGVQATVGANGAQAHTKRYKASTVQSPAEMEQIFLQMGVDFPSSAPIKEVFAQPLPTKTQAALDAYQRQLNQMQQNQRASLIAGIDFYA